MRGLIIICAALWVAGCTFDESGIASEDASNQFIDGSLSPDAPLIDAVAIDGPLLDAPLPDGRIPDAGVPDADLCAPCVDGIACTDDVCDSGGNCTFVDNCLGVTSCNMITELCDGDITFVNGVAGYADTVDTVLLQATPDSAGGAALEWGWDAAPSTEVGLITFSNIFSPARVPVGATVSAATLSLWVNNGSAGPAGSVHEVVSAWNDATTWNLLGATPGVQAEDYVSVAVAPAPSPDCAGSCNQFETVDVTSSIAKWALDDSAMRGWIFLPNSNDGVDVDSSEAPSAGRRPTLQVIFTVSPP